MSMRVRAATNWLMNWHDLNAFNSVHLVEQEEKRRKNLPTRRFNCSGRPSIVSNSRFCFGNTTDVSLFNLNIQIVQNDEWPNLICLIFMRIINRKGRHCSNMDGSDAIPNNKIIVEIEWIIRRFNWFAIFFTRSPAHCWFHHSLFGVIKSDCLAVSIFIKCHSK